MTPDAQQALETTNRLQTRACQIIEATRIQTLWETIGHTYLVGSARFGLMTTPNIDFEVYVEKPDPRDGFSVMREISSLSGITQIHYLNFLDTEDPGLYWRIDYRDNKNVLWDFDNWLVPYTHPHAGMADAFAKSMIRALNPTTRATIVTLKAALAQLDSSNKPRGIDIYKAVLRDSVQSVEAFREWQANNPPAPMETWHP